MDWEVIRFSFLNWDSIQEVYPLLLKGWWMTIKLCIAVVPLGFALGAIIAIFYSFRMKIVNVFLVIFVEFFRSIPPLVLLIYTVYGLPLQGGMSRCLARLVAFTINSSSYFGNYSCRY